MPNTGWWYAVGLLVVLPLVLTAVNAVWNRVVGR